MTRLIAALAAAFLLSGCPRGGDAPASTGSVADAPQASDLGRFDGVTLRYEGDGVGLAPALERALADRFEAATGAKIELKPQPRTQATLTSYEQRFAKRDTTLDVVILDVIWPGLLAPHLRDLRPALGTQADGMFPELIRNDTIGGKLVAMPFFSDAGLLFYRTDLVPKVPESWDDLEAEAARVQAAQRPHDPAFAGFVFQGATYEGLTCNALEWQHSHGGGGIYSEDTGAISVDNPRAARAFKRAASWVGGIAPATVLNWQEEDARRHFQAGHAAFMRNWPYAWAQATAVGSPIFGKVGVAPLPRDRADTSPAAVLGGWQLGVSAYSRHPEAAIAFVSFMTSEPVQLWRARAGAYLPTVRAAYDDPALAAESPLFAVMPRVMENLIARPSSRARERYPAVSLAYQQHVAAMLRGAAPKGELKALAQELQRLH